MDPLMVCTESKTGGSQDPESLDKYWNSVSLRYQCNICPKTFQMQQSLFCHLAWHTNNNAKKGKITEEPDYEPNLINLQVDSVETTTEETDDLNLVDATPHDTLKQYWNIDAEQYECDKCDKTYRYKQNLEGHLKAHSSGLLDKVDPLKSYWNEVTERYHCHKCDATIVSRCHMSKHLKSHGVVKTANELKYDPLKRYWNKERGFYECDKCDKTTVYSKIFAKHLKRHVKKMRVHNNKMRISSISSSDWNATTGLFECNKCDRKFLQHNQLNMHLRSHGIGLSKTEEQLKADPLRQYWNEELLRYKCDQCDKIYIDPKFMQIHLKVHNTQETDEKKDLTRSYWNASTSLFECNLCKKTFMKREFMEIHIENHIQAGSQTKQIRDAVPVKKNVEKAQPKQDPIPIKAKQRRDAVPVKKNVNEAQPKQDPVPIKIFRNKKSEQKPQKQFKCDQCDNMFMVHQHLLNHIKYHTLTESAKKQRRSQQPPPDDLLFSYWDSASLHFQCDQCEKTYEKRIHLIDHLKFHAQVNMQYNQSAVNSHWNDETDRFECDQCPLTFEKRKDIQTHLRRHVRCEIYKKQALHSLKKQDAVDVKMELGEDPSTTEPELMKLWNATLGIFECNQCDQQFVRINVLRHHIRGHAQIRRDEDAFWEQLQKGQTGSRMLVDPIRYMHLSKYWNDLLSRYECDQCDKTYVSRKPMDKHLTGHERDNGDVIISTNNDNSQLSEKPTIVITTQPQSSISNFP